MTALNCFVTDDAVHIATDGASYLTDGTVVHQVQKVLILGHLPAVIAVRGAVLHLHTLGANVAANFTGFDALVDGMPALFRSVVEQYLRAAEDHGVADRAPRDAEFVVAGWSEERSRLEAYLMNSHGRNGFEPWTLYPIPEALVSPMDGELGARIEEIADDIGEFEHDPTQASLRIMEAQRERAFPLDDGRGVLALGAFCQLTTLTRDGIATRILKRWPDAVAA